MKTTEEKFKNSIGMQLMFLQHSGATTEDTVRRIYDLAIDFASQDKWISVEDLLPKDGDEIIFCIPREIRKGVFIAVDEWKRENAFCDGAFHFIPSVTFWHPLPQPPTQNKIIKKEDESNI